jgi:tetratricopeptide (TPR) repeat protein
VPAAKPIAPPPPAKPVAAAPAAIPAPPPPPRPSLDRAALEALVARLSGADHFTVLGVKQDAQPAQIKIAYFQLAKAYHPDAVPTDAAAEVKQLCADVFAKVSEAWSVLSDNAARASYLEALAGGGTADVDVGRIFEAESLFETGTMLVKARNYAEGLKKFDEAIALNPDEAEFGMWKAWCEFVLAPDKRKRIVLSAAAIEAGLSGNPRCAQGYLFLGQMAKIVGDLALAEKQLRRGLSVAPDHADLKRELKYLRK